MFLLIHNNEAEFGTLSAKPWHVEQHHIICSINKDRIEKFVTRYSTALVDRLNCDKDTIQLFRCLTHCLDLNYQKYPPTELYCSYKCIKEKKIKMYVCNRKER